jgi:dTDP-4-dehydrorhamnose 3,5-epimerase
MRITELLPNLLLIEPKVFEDHRGHFFESFREDVLKDHGLTAPFVQDNQSLSHRGILRGLHFQKSPHAQGKFVRVITGAVLDVALDIRKDSPTYGQFVAEERMALLRWKTIPSLPINVRITITRNLRVVSYGIVPH